MIFFRLRFKINDLPKIALLTSRGWTIIHGDPGMISLLTHICPPPDLKKEKDEADETYAARLDAAMAACAEQAAQLLRGTSERP